MSDRPDDMTGEAPILDKDAALSRQEGDETFLHELWAVFVEDASSKRQGLRRALQERDLGMVEYLAHSLKSGAGTVGAMRVRDAAKELEILARQGAADKVAQSQEVLMKELDRAIALVKQELRGEPPG